MPEANANTCPGSSAPTASSSAVKLGLSYRVYGEPPPKRNADAICGGRFSGEPGARSPRPECTASVSAARSEGSVMYRILRESSTVVSEPHHILSRTAHFPVLTVRGTLIG